MAPLASIHAADRPAKPNILWLVSEDNDTFLGCYGDRLAQTPTLDRLAREGVLYERCFAWPVCAPSRFALITGMYAVTCGPAEHMRAQGKIPAWLKGLSGLPARGGLLHVEQRQDRLQLADQHHGGVERLRAARPTGATGPTRAAVLQRLQPRGHARELPVPGQGAAAGLPADGPGQGAHPALSARHAGDAGRLGAVLQPHGAAGRADRRQAQGPRADDGLADEHDRVLLLRQRRRAAAEQAVPRGERHARAADRLFPAQVAAPGARRRPARGSRTRWASWISRRRCSRWPA